MARIAIAATLLALLSAPSLAGWDPVSRTYSTAGYVSLKVDGKTPYSDATIFEDPTAWTWPASYGGVPAAMDPNADYCYSGANRISRTPNTRDFAFHARTLAVNGQFHQSSEYYFTMTNMHLLSGGQFVIWGSHSRFANCNFTVYADRTNPFKANVSVNVGGPKDGFVFADTTIRGDADAVMTLWGDRATQQFANFWWTGDGSDYRGTLRVEMSPNNVSNGVSCLYLGPVGFAGTVALGKGGRLRPYGTNEVRLARLATTDGGALYRSLKEPMIVVTEDIDRTSPLALRVALPDGHEEDVDVFRGPPAALHAATYRLEDADGNPLHYGWTPQVREEADGLATLFLHDSYEVTLVSNVNNAAGSPFLPENASFWSDGRVPHLAGEYVVSSSKYVYMPHNGTYVFPGRTLTLKGSATLNNTSPLVFTCADLRVVKGMLRAQACDFTINGAIDVQGPLHLQHYNGRTSAFAVMSTLKGAGDITIDSYISMYEHGSVGSIELGGINDAFTGRITVTSPTAQKDYGSVPSLTRSVTLSVSDARSLGGPRTSFTPDALQLEQMSVLKPLADMTLSAKNRGVRIVGCGRFNVPRGVTLAVANPITYAGELRKEGAGTLVLAAPSRFLDGSASACPRTGTNVLTLAEGTLRVDATNALSGVHLVIGGQSRLVVPVAPSDAALRTFGAVNLTEPDDAPLAVDTSAILPRVNVRFDTTGAASAPPARVWTNALFTVSAAAAARMEPLFELEKPYVGYATTLKRRTNANGSVTLCAVHEELPAYEVTPASAAKPIFSGSGVVTVPPYGCLRYVGWGQSAELGVRVVLASGSSYALPASWEGWSADASVTGASLLIREEDGLIVARLLKDEAAYARAGGELHYTGCEPNGRIRIRVDSSAYGAGSVVPDGDNEYSYTNRTVASDLTFFGNLRVRQRDPRTARAVWTFHPNRDTAKAVTNVTLTLDLGAAFSAGSLRSDGAVHKSGSTKQHVGKLEILDAAGWPQLVLEMPASNKTYAAQSESAGTATVRISVPAPTGGFRAGEDSQLVVDLSGPAAVKAEMPPLVTTVKGEDWLPTDLEPYVKAGSALDFSNLCGTGKPAGKYGRVVCAGDHFEFANLPGVPQRFWGVTMGGTSYTPAAWLGEVGFADLARRGYNATRVHDYESAIISTNDPTATSFNADKIRLFDQYVATAVSNGFYIVLELYGNHRTPTWRSIGENRDGNVSRDEVKSLLLTHEGMFSNQLAYVRAYLTRKNTVTGRSFIDEPAVLGVDFVNEHYLGVSRVQDVGAKAGDDLKKAWSRYVAARKAKEGAKYAAVTDAIPSNLDTTLAGRLYAQFLRETFDTYERRMHAFLRDELKFKGLRTNLNNGGPVSLTYSAARRQYTDMHFYQDHPNYLGNGTAPETFRHENANPVSYSNAGVPKVALVRQRGKPFVITEYNYCAPSRFRMAGGLLMGSVAALQGWSGLWLHAYGFTEKRARMSNFSYLNDPLMPAWSRAAAMLFARGDLPTLTNEYVTRLDPAALQSTDEDAHAGLTDSSAPLARAAWYARVSQAVTNALPAGVPTSGDWTASLAKTDAEVLNDLGLARAVADGSLPLAGGGHVAVDDLRGRIAVFTDRTCGGFAENGTITAGVFRAEIGNVPAAVWASSLDGRPLARSGHILVSHLTDVQDDGDTYLDDSMKTLLNWGNLPHLMRRGVARVTVPVAGLCRVYALASDGTRLAEVPVSRGSGGTCVFTCDTARDPDEATYLYEVVCRPGAIVRFRGPSKIGR